jgi:hypothetical protein
MAFAQVYKSYDADGNVVFSDKPTQGSQEVEITEPNVGDSFEIPPPPAEPLPETEPEPESSAPPITDESSADTNQDGRISKREKEEQREERRRKKREREKAAEGNKE